MKILYNRKRLTFDRWETMWDVAFILYVADAGFSVRLAWATNEILYAADFVFGDSK